MSISLKGKRMLYKSELMMLEMLANTNWERPLYMAITVGSDNHLNLGNNFMQDPIAAAASAALLQPFLIAIAAPTV